MARLGRRQPQQSRLRQPAAIGPALVFRALRVWLADPLRPVHRVTARASHSKLRQPSAVGAPVVFGPVSRTLVAVQFPHVVTTQKATSYRLQAPTVVSTPAAPFVASPVVVRAVAVFVQQAAGGQRRAPVSRLNAPAVVGTATTFGPLKVTTVDQPRRYQHVVYKLQQPVTIGAAAVQFMPDAIRSKLTRRPPNYIRVKPQLRPPTVVDPQIVTTLPYPVRVKLVPPSVNARHAKSVLRPPRAVAPAVTFRPLGVSFTQAIATRTGYQRHASRYRLLPPTVVDAGTLPAPWIEAGFNATSTLEGAGTGSTMTAAFSATATLEGEPDETGMEAGAVTVGGLEA